jgi:uncharacterized damage-inducible protein DinB
MKKADFMNTLLAARADWEAALCKLTTAQMTRPQPEGAWSVKDVLAHVAWHEREMVGILTQQALVGSPWWNLPLDERNALIHAEQRDLSLAQVLQQARQSWQTLLQLVQALNDEQLINPALYREMPAGWSPWQILADNTYLHYRDHMADLRRAAGRAS